MKNTFAVEDNIYLWEIYEDPDKQFSLNYPPDWIAEPRKNSSEEHDILFTTNMTTLGVDVFNLPRSVDVFNQPRTADLKETMKSSVESTTNNPNNTSLKMKLFEGPEFVKYKVSGNPAGSATWVIDASEDRAVYQFILSIVDDKLVRIDYNSPAQDFDKYLPQVEKVIQSIKVK